MKYSDVTVQKLNADISTHFPHIYPIEKDDNLSHQGVSRLVMLDRYAQKDRSHKTLGVGDIVVTVVKEDPKFPSRGIGTVQAIENEIVSIVLEEEFRGSLDDEIEAETGLIKRPSTSS